MFYNIPIRYDYQYQSRANFLENIVTYCRELDVNRKEMYVIHNMIPNS